MYSEQLLFLFGLINFNNFLTMRNVTPLLVFIILFNIISSCSDKDDIGVDALGYYPLTNGKFWIYNVKEEIYIASQSKPTLRNYQEKDEVIGMNANSSGRITYLIAKSQRSQTTDQWELQKSFSVEVFPDKILTTIDNKIYMTLVMPMNPSTMWNVNSYNILEPVLRKYQYIGAASNVLDKVFDNTITIIEEPEDTLLSLVKKNVIYGYNEGILYEEDIDFEYCQDDDCIGEKIIESGSSKIRTLVIE